MTLFPEAIGWTLLHFIWQAAVIAILYRLIDWRLARSRADVRYSVALAALLCMFGTSIATVIYEQIRLNHGAFPDAADALTVVTASAGRIPSLGLLGTYIQDHIDQFLRWVDCAWLIGVCFFALRVLGGAWRLSRFRSMLSFEAVGDVAARFSAVAQEMAVKSRSALRIHPAAEAPFVAGLFRSVIYLPISALTSLTPDQLDTILIHELAHIRRADYTWNLLQTMMETVFFFHPAVWWLGRVLRERRELCCDDIVVAMCSNPVTYAKALLALAEHQPIRPRLAMALDGHQGHNRLFARIARILGEADVAGEDSGSNAPSRLLISVIAGIAVLCWSFLIPLSPHVPFVHAERATHINASLQSPLDARGIQPGELNSRFRSALRDAPQTKAPLTAPGQATPLGESKVQLVAFDVTPGLKAAADSVQALTQQPLFHIDAYETHKRHQHAPELRQQAQEGRQQVQERSRQQVQEVRQHSQELRQQVQERNRQQARKVRQHSQELREHAQEFRQQVQERSQQARERRQHNPLATWS